MPDHPRTPHPNPQSTSRTRRSFFDSPASSTTTSSSSSPTPRNTAAPVTSPSPKTSSSPQDSTYHPPDEVLQQPPTPPIPEMQPAKKRRLLRVPPPTTESANHKWTRNDDRLLLNFWERNIEHFCVMSKVAFGNFAAANLNKEFTKRGDVLTTRVQVTNKLGYWERRVAELGRKDKLSEWDYELYTRGARLMKIVEEMERERERKNEVDGGEDAREDDNAGVMENVRTARSEQERDENEEGKKDQYASSGVSAGESSMRSVDDGAQCLRVEHASDGQEGRESRLERCAISVEMGMGGEQEQIVDQGRGDDDDMNTVYDQGGGVEETEWRPNRFATRCKAFTEHTDDEREQDVEHLSHEDDVIKAVPTQTALTEEGEGSVEILPSLRRSAPPGTGRNGERRLNVELGYTHGGRGNVAALREGGDGVGNTTKMMCGPKVWGGTGRGGEWGRFEMKKAIVVELINLAREFKYVREGSDAYQCLTAAKDMLVAAANKLTNDAV